MLALVIVAASCAKEPGGEVAAGEPLYVQDDTPANLKGLVETIFKAAESGQARKAATLIRSLIADPDAAKKAMRDDAPAAFVTAYHASAAENLGASDAALLSVFRRGDPGRTQINVHGATTEEIALRDVKSIAYAEFPGGANRLAKVVLRPGVRFYEVELVKPGENVGLKYHLFFWDGARWRMFGPAWRSLPGNVGD